MAREGDKWRVVRGDCLWNIAKSVYGNPYKWTVIADANGVSRRTALIYPGQLFILPGITAGTSGGGASTPAPTPVSNKVTIQWWALDAGTDKDMFCTWTFNRANTGGYSIEVWYDTGSGGWRNQVKDSNTTLQQYGFTANANAKKVMLKIKPYSTTYRDGQGNEHYHWTDGQWVEVIYDFSNNPPLIPSTPTVVLDPNTGKLTCSLSNISEDINGNQIEFVVYKDNIYKYKSGIANITTADDGANTRYVSIVFDVEPGGSYTVRCRAIRNGNIYSNWSDYTDSIKTIPLAPTAITELRPQVISEQGSKQYGVYIEWTPVDTAKNYEIQYTTDPTYFDVSSNVESVTTDETQGNKMLITGIELGHEYFFRVRSINDSGNSGWTPVKSTKLGSRPSAPTTWSNTQNCVTTEILRLYWTHNSTDGSLESLARIHFTIINTMHPELVPNEIIKTIRNDRPEEDKGKTSVFELNPQDSSWGLSEGCIIKWKVQTAGVVEEYSDWSIEREINVYVQPEVAVDIKNQNGQSMNEVSSFPFYINVLATPPSQIPISYYVEIVANQGYETVDDVGKRLVVNQGDKVYQKYFDPTDSAWEFMLEMTPGNIDLMSGISYTVNCTVAMNSGLTASNSTTFDVIWNDLFYEVGANIILNKDTLEASINPYCNEFYTDEASGEILPKLTENCTLSIYRREYDGSFTLIAEEINNSENTYVVDPHPALDYARYRVTATSKDTGSISFGDIKAVKFGEPSLVIQWAEEWTKFETTDEELEEPAYAGSMIKIPYNVDISESAKIDVEKIDYVGRQHPVSYYGTKTNESFTGNVEIPREDINLIYDLRRLAKYAGDVYVREPSGIGYWATITVSFSLKHNAVTVPVTFNITRVEGGI